MFNRLRFELKELLETEKEFALKSWGFCEKEFQDVMNLLLKYYLEHYNNFILKKLWRFYDYFRKLNIQLNNYL